MEPPERWFVVEMEEREGDAVVERSQSCSKAKRERISAGERWW